MVAAARAAGDAAGIPLVINARTDVYLTGAVPEEERLVATLERGAAYLEAGADCVFVPGVRDLDTLETLAREMGGPISVLGGAGGPTLAELARIGRRPGGLRPGPLGVAMAALSRAAETLLAGGDPPADLAFRVGMSRRGRTVRAVRPRYAVATITARVFVPPVRRRRCGVVPSKYSVSPSESSWIVPLTSTSIVPRAA